MARITRKKANRKDLVRTGVLLLAIIWFSFLVHSIYKKEEVARRTVHETQAELAALDARTKTLSGTVGDMDTQRGQEASVRETFGVAKPGEEVIIVVPKKEVAPPPPLTFWQKVRNFFGL
jgi:cell division protein FtsB